MFVPLVFRYPLYVGGTMLLLHRHYEYLDAFYETHPRDVTEWVATHLEKRLYLGVVHVVWPVQHSLFALRLKSPH